jgi:hypothetical protein
MEEVIRGSPLSLPSLPSLFSVPSSLPPLSLPLSKELQEIYSTRNAPKITETSINQDVEESLSVWTGIKLIRLISAESYAHGQPLVAPPIAAPPSSQPTRRCPARGNVVPNYALDAM